ncbi:MAG: hypothetical protein ACO1Q7_04475 [Gemmatimonas sp.]
MTAIHKLTRQALTTTCAAMLLSAVELRAQAPHAREETQKDWAAQSLAKMPEVRLTAVQNDKELVLTFGPMDLDAHAGHHGGTPEPPPRWITIPEDASLHGYSVELRDKHGQKVPSSTLHHVNVIAVQQRELFSNIMLRVAAASSETQNIKLPRLLGLKAKKGDTLLVRTMLHNNTGKSYEGVSVIVRFPLSKENSTIGSFRIQPFYLDVTEPSGPHDFDIPPGRSEQYWESKPAVDVRIIGFTGHVHKYATALRFEDRTDKKVIWETKPDTNAQGEPKAIPIKRYLFPRVGKGIDSSHVYRLTVVYENPTGATIKDGGMGALGGVVMVGKNTPWPAVDPNHPEFKRDLRAMWRP